MINYTTPTIQLTIEGKDISSHDIYATLEQGAVELTKTGNDLSVQTDTHGQITDTIITFVLTQLESASFDFTRSVSVQVNWISSSGVREATNIQTIPVMRNLLAEVIEYGN